MAESAAPDGAALPRKLPRGPKGQALRAILVDLRGSRGYKLMRKLGRWRSIERGMRRARVK